MVTRNVAADAVVVGVPARLLRSRRGRSDQLSVPSDKHRKLCSNRGAGPMIGIGIIGYGYWGPNLARCAAETEGCRVVGIADCVA